MRREHENKQASYYIAEPFDGRLARSVRLPSTVDVDRGTVRFDNGVLRVELSTRVGVKPKQIKVQ